MLTPWEKLSQNFKLENSLSNVQYFSLAYGGASNLPPPAGTGGGDSNTGCTNNCAGGNCTAHCGRI